MGLKKLTIRDVPLDGRTVLVRSDLDVPMESIGVVADDSRIIASLPTLKNLLNRGCKVVVIGHMDGHFAPSMEPVARRLARLLGQDIRFTDGVVGDKVFQAIKRAPRNSLIMLENLRYHPEDGLNDRDFAANLAKSTGAKYFVQDNPRIVGQNHSVTNQITLLIPSVAGLLLAQTDGISDDLPGTFGLLDARSKLE